MFAGKSGLLMLGPGGLAGKCSVTVNTWQALLLITATALQLFFFLPKIMPINLLNKNIVLVINWYQQLAAALQQLELMRK